MPGHAMCLDEPMLERIDTGDLSDAEIEQVALHLEECPACAQRVQVLPGNARAAEAVQAGVRNSGPLSHPLIPALIERLCALPAPATTRSPDHTPVRPSARNPAAAELLSAILAPPEAPDELGRLGPYRVLQVLGVGGMGIVLRAEDPVLRRAVALKVLLPAVAAEEENRQRFLREARAAAAIEHDHIVPIYHVGEAQGVPFLVMPLLKGESLAVRFRHQRRLPLTEVLQIGQETAAGLAAAHAAGLVHRDVKPDNLWLERKEEKALPGSPFRVKILDFGLARSVAVQPGEAVTERGTVVGTLAFMSPEQARAGAVDARSDLFSLGCVLYQLTTGEPPFRGPDTLAVLTALAVDEPRPPRTLNPELPEGLNALILRLLAKKPADRPATAAAVSQQLGVLREQAVQSNAGDRAPVPAMPRVNESGQSLRVPPVRGLAWGPWLRWVALAAVVLLIVAGYAFWSPKPLPPLKGSLEVVVARGPEGGRDYLRLDHPAALPLKPGVDYVQIQATLNRPAYQYLVWVDTDGKAVLLHPWDKQRKGRPADEQPLQDLFWPTSLTAAKLGGGHAGMESILLLAREAKLPEDVDIPKVFEGLPRQKGSPSREAAWFENGLLDRYRAPINFRGDRGNPLLGPEALIDDPVLQTQALLRTRLKELFPYSRAVCFANAGDR
jgi:serine/threonine protein kinase